MDVQKSFAVFIYMFVLFYGVHAVYKDIVFVVDRSGSISDYDLRLGLDFLYNVSQWLTIGPRDIQVSLVTFSDFPEEKIALGTNNDHESLMNALKSLKAPNVISTGGGTETQKALEYVRERVLSHGRTGAEKVVVVLTDGYSDNKTTTLDQANVLKDNFNTTIFAIGIGSALSAINDELSGIASSPKSYYVHKVNAFLYLCNIIPALVPKLDPNATARAIVDCPKPTSPFPIFALKTTSQARIIQNVVTELTTTTQSRLDQNVNVVTIQGFQSDNDGNSGKTDSRTSKKEDNNITLTAGAVAAVVAALLLGAAAFVYVRKKWFRNNVVSENQKFQIMDQYSDAPRGQTRAKFDSRYLR